MGRFDRASKLVDSSGNDVNVGNPLPVTGGGGGGGGGAVTVADGADTAEGATTDLAVTGDNPGTLSAKFRGFNKILFDVWDSVNHAFRVNLVSGSAGQADNTTFTEGSTSFTPVGGEYNSAPGSVTDGSAASVQLTQKRALHTNLRNTAGTEIGTSGAPLRTDPTGGTTQPVSGAVSVSNLPADQLVHATNLDVALSTRTKPSDQQHTIVDSGSLSVSNFPADQLVHAANLDVALSTRTKPSDQQHAIVDSSALPTGASTEATLALIKAKTDNLDVALSTLTKPADTQVVSQTNIATANYDTGAGTVVESMVGIALPANGGPVAGGTAANPVRVDPTGATTQPVSGTVAVSNFPVTQPVSGTLTANQGTASNLSNGWPVKISDGSNALGTIAHPLRVDPIGSTTQPIMGSVTVSNFPADQLVHAANLDVALSTRTKPSDQQHAIVDSSALPSGAATEATLGEIATDTDNLDVLLSTRTKPSDQQHVIIDSGNVTQPDLLATGAINGIGQLVSTATLNGASTAVIEISGTFVAVLKIFPLSTSLTGGVNIPFVYSVYPGGFVSNPVVAAGSYIINTAGMTEVGVFSTGFVSGSATVNIRTSAGVSRVYVDQGLPVALNQAWPVEMTDGTNVLGTSGHPVRVLETLPASTPTSVDLLSATDATRVLTILAANSSRRGATIKNDTDAALLVCEGGNASPTNYTDVLPPGGRWILDYPASTSILTAYLPQVPNGRLLATERA